MVLCRGHASLRQQLAAMLRWRAAGCLLAMRWRRGRWCGWKNGGRRCESPRDDTAGWVVLGGDPTLANDVTIPMPVLTGSGASRTATIEYPRRSISAYLNPVLELSDNLDAWNTAVNGANGASIVVTPNFYATGLDKVSVTLPAEGSRGFARISVTNP